MYCIPYEVLTNFIAEKCVFTSPDIEFLSIFTGGDKWRRYHIEDGKVTKAQFFVENIPDFNCFIEDIYNTRQTNRITMKLARPRIVKKRLTEIKTVDDLYHLIGPNCTKLLIDNGIMKKYSVKDGDQSIIQSVDISKFDIVIHTKF